MADRCHILGIPGSLRAGSFNRGLLQAAADVAPEGVQIEVADLGDLPLFNADVDAAGPPPSVQALKARIRGADALLIATPENNYSIPGVLKNALDWASRPPADGPLRFKPLAIIGASTGDYGTVRAQLALRQVFLFTESYALLKPELMVTRASDHFDTNGNLTDDKIRARLRALIEALVEWTRRFAPAEERAAAGTGR